MASVRRRTWRSSNGAAKSTWLVDYRDQQGKRRAKKFDRKKDAEAWAATAVIEVQRGIHTPDSTSITVEAAAKLWLEAAKAHDREPTTIAAYEQHVRLHIVPQLGARKLSQLTSPIIRATLDTWLAELSRPMATRVFRSLKSILSDAQERGLVAQNVALSVKIRKEPRRRRRVSPPTKDELRRILKSAAQSDDLKGRAIVEVAIFTGMRASEIRGLAWRSIDFKHSAIAVEQRAEARGVIGPPKTEAGVRRIPIPSLLVSTLRQWKLACPPHPLGLVFPSEKGRVLSHSVMASNHLKPIIVAAGVTKTKHDEEVAKYTAHVFRHAAASLWIEHGLNPKRIQTLMGHSSIQVTFDIYGHLFEQAEKDADDANAIERALGADAT